MSPPPPLPEHVLVGLILGAILLLAVVAWLALLGA